MTPSSAQFGLCILHAAPAALERIGPDWDWIWLDGQHGDLTPGEIAALVRVCDLIGKPAYVRVASHDPGLVGQALDMGAAGIVAPLVDGVEPARALVRAAKFPPLGNRSFGGARLVGRRGRGYADTANAQTRLVVQIESPAGIDQAAAIAAVPGVDALFVGPADLLLRRGLAPDSPAGQASLRHDLEIVARACREHGKQGVMIGYEPDLLRLGLDLGYALIVAGCDSAFLARGSRQAAAAARVARDGARAPAPSVPPEGAA